MYKCILMNTGVVTILATEMGACTKNLQDISYIQEQVLSCISKYTHPQRKLHLLVTGYLMQ